MVDLGKPDSVRKVQRRQLLTRELLVEIPHVLTRSTLAGLRRFRRRMIQFHMIQRIEKEIKQSKL